MMLNAHSETHWSLVSMLLDAYTVKGSVYVDDLHLIIVFKLKAKRKKLT